MRKESQIIHVPDMGNFSKITDHLYVGDSQSPHQYSKLCEEGIKSVVNLSGELYNPKEAGLISFHHLHLSDDETNSEKDMVYAYEVAKAAYSYHSPTLVHCLAGISRSANMAAALLFTLDNYSWSDTVEAVESGRPVAYLASGFGKKLRKVLGINVKEDS